MWVFSWVMGVKEGSGFLPERSRERLTEELTFGLGIEVWVCR